MKPKTKKIIALVMTIVFVLGILALVLPATINHKPSQSMQDFGRLRQIAQGLIVYANDTGKYPERIQDIIGPDYVEDSAEVRDLVSRTQYFKPPGIQEKKFAMLILPVEGGVVVCYSTGQAEFLKPKKKS